MTDRREMKHLEERMKLEHVGKMTLDGGNMNYVCTIHQISTYNMLQQQEVHQSLSEHIHSVCILYVHYCTPTACGIGVVTKHSVYVWGT